MINRNLWIFSIWCAGLGILLLAAGYFSIMFDPVLIYPAASKALVALGVLSIASYYVSGIRKHIWSLRSALDVDDLKSLSKLRVAGVFASMLMCSGIGTPLFAAIFKSPLGPIGYNTVVLASGIVVLMGFLVAVGVRVAEFRLYKKIDQRINAVSR